MSSPFTPLALALKARDYSLHGEKAYMSHKSYLRQIAESAEKLWDTSRCLVDLLSKAHLEQAEEPTAGNSSFRVSRVMEASFSQTFEAAYEIWQASGRAEKDSLFPNLMDQFFLNPIFDRLTTLHKVQKCFFEVRDSTDPEAVDAILSTNPLACLLLNDKIENPKFKQLVINALAKSNREDLKRYLRMPLMQFPCDLDESVHNTSNKMQMVSLVSFLSSMLPISDEEVSNLSKGYVWMMAIQEGWNDLLQIVLPRGFLNEVVRAEQFMAEAADIDAVEEEAVEVEVDAVEEEVVEVVENEEYPLLMQYALSALYFDNRKCIDDLDERGVWGEIKRVLIDKLKAKWGDEESQGAFLYPLAAHDKCNVLNLILKDSFFVDAIMDWRLMEEEQSTGLSFAHLAAKYGSLGLLNLMYDHHKLRDLIPVENPTIQNEELPDDPNFLIDSINIAFAAALHGQVEVLNWIRNHSDENISSLFTKAYQYDGSTIHIASEAVEAKSTETLMMLLKKGDFSTYFEDKSHPLMMDITAPEATDADKGNPVHQLFLNQAQSKSDEDVLSLFKALYQDEQLRPWLFKETEKGLNVMDLILIQGHLKTFEWLEQIGELYSVVSPEQIMRCFIKAHELCLECVDVDKYKEFIKRVAKDHPKALIEVGFKLDAPLLVDRLVSIESPDSLFDKNAFFKALIDKWVENGSEMDSFFWTFGSEEHLNELVNIGFKGVNIPFLNQLIRSEEEIIEDVIRVYLENDDYNLDRKIEIWALNAFSSKTLSKDVKSSVLSKFLGKNWDETSLVTIYLQLTSHEAKEHLYPYVEAHLEKYEPEQNRDAIP